MKNGHLKEEVRKENITIIEWYLTKFPADPDPYKLPNNIDVYYTCVKIEAKILKRP
jgi:hypothetical protein